MRRLLAAMVLLTLAACTPGGDSGGQARSAAPGSGTQKTDTQKTGAPRATEPAVPPAPKPAADEPCPYLDAAFVEQTNGQRVARVRTSTDKPHPACFFYRADGTVQLTARVYVGEVRVARALIDRAAPVDTSSPATQPPGWQGGYQPVEGGAVYAVTKGSAAVVINTNQRQTVKAREVAKRVIAALAL